MSLFHQLTLNLVKFIPPTYSMSG